MYQAIFYDFQTYTYHLRDDKQGWMDFQLQPTFWKRVPEWQENARPVLTGGWAIPTRKYDKDDKDLLEKDFKDLYEKGYKKENIEVTTEYNKLTIEAKKINDAEYEYVHHGLAKRAFTRTWTLSDDVVVGDVAFVNGLLTIKLNRIIPDHQKKKVYEIVSGVHADNS